MVEEKYNFEPKEIDINQYDNLKKEISKLKELIDNIDGKLREPGMVNDASINSVLSEELESLNKEISDLRTEIKVIDGKFKHDDRKKYNLKVKQLENRLSKVGNFVKEEKDNIRNIFLYKTFEKFILKDKQKDKKNYQIT